MNTLLISSHQRFVIAALFLGTSVSAVTIGDAELRGLLTTALQTEHVKDKGELELRFQRPWSAVTLPDGDVSVKILELPATGIGANFIVRFELRGGKEVRGPWQLPVQAKVWREVWVANAALRVGLPLAEAELVKERRDVLSLREPAWNGDAADRTVELCAFVPAGATLMARAVRLRPVVRRGQSVEALCRDGAMSVTMKVEVLQDGAPGDIVRIRNNRSRKEFLGKVQDEHTILVSL
jgi:flagella basal body P-ring formation protein FlgA